LCDQRRVPAVRRREEYGHEGNYRVVDALYHGEDASFDRAERVEAAQFKILS
jgi:hypothetical protein